MYARESVKKKGANMEVKPIIQSQYLASLAMLKQAILKCPPEAWNNPQDKNRFWFVAYHTLFYAHLYLKAQDKGYARWERRQYSRPGVPFSKEEILERCAAVEQDVAGQVPLMGLDGKSERTGFLADELESQLCNLRHIQHHAGELYERLGSRENVKLNWVEQRHPKVKK